MVELGRGGITLRIRGVHAIDLRRLEDHVGLDLDCAQRRGGVGCEVRVSRAGGEDHDPSFLEVPDGAAPDVGLRNLRHLDRRHRPRGDAGPLEGVLQREGVDDGRQHAHVVARRPVEATLGRRKSAEDVASADHQRDLHAHLVHALDLRGDGLDDLEVDAVIPLAAKRFTAQLEQDAVVLRRAVDQLVQDSLMLNRANRRTEMFSCSFEMCSATSSCTVRPGSRK